MTGGAGLQRVAAALPDGIVDAHHHLWDLSAGRYPWLQDRYEPHFFLGPYRAICRNYGVEDLRRDQAPMRIAGSVHIEAERDRADQLGETRWLEQVHQETGLPSACVGHVSFLQPDMASIIRGHSASKLMRGIRSKPVTASEPGSSVRGQPGSLQHAAVHAGLQALEAAGLSWDLRVPFWHLAEAAEAIAPLPGLTVIVNHCGLPLDRSAEGLAAWRAGLAVLASHPRTFLKLSEFGLAGGGFDPRGTAKLVQEAVAIFGLGRVMYGSNLPVSSLGANIGPIVDAILDGIGEPDDATIRAVFADNARRAYRLPQGRETT
ncbi:MAG: amidohydrolase family protein [Acetobacteraceae bacterium]|nr:amidohydrolase family protein [Acetobacteraceae bacterium]